MGVASFAYVLALQAFFLGEVCTKAGTAGPVLVDGGSVSNLEEYGVTSWHTESGLPDGNVTSIAQTPDGYLWVGTFKGLARFDGDRFVIFNAAREKSLPDERVARLLVDREGRLWIGYESGKVVWLAGGIFHQVAFAGEFAASVSARIGEGVGGAVHAGPLPQVDLAEDIEGAIWLRSDSSRLMRLKAGRAEAWSSTNGGPPGALFALEPDASRHPWLLAGESWYQWTNQTWQVVAKADNLGNRAPVFAQARGGGLWAACPKDDWFSSPGMVSRILAGPGSTPLQPTPSAAGTERFRITAALEDHSGRVWIGMHWGGVRYADKAGCWQIPLKEGPLQKTQVACLFEARDGSLWVGTTGDGLQCLRPRLIRTVRLPASASAYLVNSVCAARDGSIWAGTDGAGVFRYQGGAMIHFGTNNGLPSSVIWALYEDSRTNLWCATSGGVCGLKGNCFFRVSGLEANTVFSIYEDRQRRVWFGSPDGPLMMEGTQLSNAPWLPKHEVSAIHCLSEDPAGKLWAASRQSGVLCLGTNELAHFGPPEGLSLLQTRSIWCDADGGVWVGTRGGGLFYRAGGRFRPITSADGLPDDTINSITEDVDGTLWFGSYNGFFGCSRRLLESYERGQSPPLVCRWLSPADGLDYRACSGTGQPVVSRAADGRIWFVNQGSLAVLDPAQARPLPPPTNVMVESVLVDGVEVAREAAGDVRFSSRARRLEFYYTCPDFAMPHRLSFRYQLAGFDEKWVEADGRRVAYYGNLRPGKYAFKAWVGGADGRWHESARAISVEVAPQLWERTSIQAASVVSLILLVAGTAWSVSRNRMKRKILLLNMQQATELERRRIAQDLHDDLGGSLTAISMLATSAQRETSPPPETMAEIRQRADTLVRALDEIVWAVNPLHDSLESFAEYLIGFARDFLRLAGLRLRLDVPPSLPPARLSPDVRHGIYLAAKEALTNAVRHAQATEVCLRLRVCEGLLAVGMEDNGRGFDVNSQRRGDGLKNMRERLASLGGACEISSRPGAGTTVEFKIRLPWS